MTRATTVTRAVSTHDSGLVTELIDAGIIPAQCRKWELIADANSVLIARSEVIVTPEQMEAVKAALLRHLDEPMYGPTQKANLSVPSDQLQWSWGSNFPAGR